MHRQRWAVRLLLATLVASGACNGDRRTIMPDPVATGQQCRTYATAWTTSSPGGPSSSSAEFDMASRVYQVFSPAGSSRVVARQVYATTGDFLEEPAVLGRVLYTRREECATDDCVGGLAVTYVPTYDGQRRTTSVTTRVSGVALITETYGAWDTLGRPTTGNRSHPPICDSVPMTIDYDDAGRTVTNQPTGPGVGLLCLGLIYETTRTYDANGNLVAERTAVGGTTTGTTHTVTSTATLCN